MIGTAVFSTCVEGRGVVEGGDVVGVGAGPHPTLKATIDITSIKCTRNSFISHSKA
jgi:hypothetical protein